jgi:hypothetical protein
MLKRLIFVLACLVLVNSSARAQTDEAENLFPVIKGGKWGYINRSGKLAIKPQFDAAHPFYDGIAKVMFGKRFTAEQWTYIDQKGKPIFKGLSVNRLEDFSEGLGAVCLYEKDEIGYLCGYLDRSGNWAIAPKFYSAFSFNDGLARAATKDKNSRTGTRQVYLDKSGSEAIDLSAVPTRSGERFSQGLARFAAATANNKGVLPQGFMDKSGRVVIEPKFEAADDFSEGLAAVMFFKPAKKPDEAHDEDYDAGFIDPTGRIVIKPQFEYYQSFSEGLAFVLIRGKMGAIDKTGRVVIRPRFDLPRRSSHWYWEVLDYYQQARPWSFSEGLAAVHRRGRWGYVNKDGRLAIPARFQEAHQFSGGLALVMIANRVGYIDKTGKYVWRPTR